MNWNSRQLVVLVLAVLAISGCSGAVTPPRSVPVSGTVTLKGKPATGVLVKFHPQFNMGKVKFTPQGETNAEGAFVLTTGAPLDGAPTGDYLVTFEKLNVVSDLKNSGIETEVDEFKGRYSDPASSSHKVTVQSGENRLPPFALE